LTGDFLLLSASGFQPEAAGNSYGNGCGVGYNPLRDFRFVIDTFSSTYRVLLVSIA